MGWAGKLAPPAPSRGRVRDGTFPLGPWLELLRPAVCGSVVRTALIHFPWPAALKTRVLVGMGLSIHMPAYVCICPLSHFHDSWPSGRRGEARTIPQLMPPWDSME